MKTVLVTGAAGFIGAAVSTRLLKDGYRVVGIDSINDYYSPALKAARLEPLLLGQPNYRFEMADVTDMDALTRTFATHKPDYVVHLAAQAGVRYSVSHPHTYSQANLVGFLNILEACRHAEKPIEHLAYASSSSVYGGNEKVPFSEEDPVTQPQSLYAATKRSNELMAQSYAHLYGLKSTGMRFFTVYGPWGRPDMSPMLFAKAILDGTPIKVFNHGNLWRDFTYIDDIVEGVVRLMTHQPQTTPPHDVYNLGNHNPVKLLDYITAMEEALGKKAILDMQPLPPTEVLKTYADTSKIRAAVGFAPDTPLKDGLKKFATWYTEYHNTLGKIADSQATAAALRKELKEASAA
ncbi:MAG: NAD-dependent epimerase/dehydratase family protein [Proteobacteria bacterium]|nr:NAD-dependent epimerase/dehydratase family protein [Pseudomonadota bacterium]